MHTDLRSLFLCLIIGSSASATGALAIDIEATASGFIKNPATDGPNDPWFDMLSIQNYQAGYNKTTDETTQNWFIFELPVLAPGESVESAKLSLYLPKFAPGVTTDAGDGYGSADPMEDFAIFGLSTDAAAAISPSMILDDGTYADDGPFFDAYYGFLTAGTELGAVMVEEADEGTTVVISFSAPGIADLSSYLGGLYMFGGAVVSIDNPPGDDIAEGLFHHSHPFGYGGPPTAAPVLTIEVVPEPSTYATILGFFGLALVSWRRKR